MTQRLERRFGAVRHAMGIRNPEEVMEVWTDARGDWNLVITYSSGRSCIVAMGENWMELAPRPTDAPETPRQKS